MGAVPGEHHWKPGQSGNPSGRKKGAGVGIAKRARELVGDDGGPLVEFFYAIVQLDPAKLKKYKIVASDVTLKDRRDSADWLACRGWGKAPDVQAQEGDDPLGLNGARDNLAGKLAKVIELDDARREEDDSASASVAG